MTMNYREDGSDNTAAGASGAENRDIVVVEFSPETFEFTCDSCGAVVVAEEDWRGCASECPSCGNAMEVPTKAAALKGIVARCVPHPEIGADGASAGNRKMWIAGALVVMIGIGITSHLRAPDKERITGEQVNELIADYRRNKTYVRMLTESNSEMLDRLDYFKRHPSEVHLLVVGPGSPAAKLRAYEENYRQRVKQLEMTKLDMWAQRRRLERIGFSASE